jgi:hypothetical protein
MLSLGKSSIGFVNDGLWMNGWSVRMFMDMYHRFGKQPGSMGDREAERIMLLYVNLSFTLLFLWYI